MFVTEVESSDNLAEDRLCGPGRLGTLGFMFQGVRHDHPQVPFLPGGLQHDVEVNK